MKKIFRCTSERHRPKSKAARIVSIASRRKGLSKKWCCDMKLNGWDALKRRNRGKLSFFCSREGAFGDSFRTFQAPSKSFISKALSPVWDQRQSIIEMVRSSDDNEQEISVLAKHSDPLRQADGRDA
jgi:hypothetical protein